MRGNPQAIASRLPRAAPRRRWSLGISDVIQERRRRTAQRHELIERFAREERRARIRGQEIPQERLRIRGS
jgi:hypothetical protein